MSVSGRSRRASVAAFTATDEARLQLPDDPTLIEAAEKLKAKAEELRSVSESLKLKADVALATGKKQADALAAANRQLEASMAETSRLEKAIAAAQATHADEETRAKAIAAEIAAATDHLTTLLSDDFQIAQLKPLTPEQMCWSILKVTGVYDRYRKAEEAELDKSKPLDRRGRRTTPPRFAPELRARSSARSTSSRGTSPAFVAVYAAGCRPAAERLLRHRRPGPVRRQRRPRQRLDRPRRRECLRPDRSEKPIPARPPKIST